MRVIFYNNTSDKKVVQKDLTLIATIECDIYNALNVLTPGLLINNRQHNLLNCNYCYIADLNRYYFCNVILDSHKTIVNCSVDVLMSNDLSNIKATITRNENIRNFYIVDNTLPISVKRQIIVESFGTEIEIGSTYVIGVI